LTNINYFYIILKNVGGEKMAFSGSLTATKLSSIGVITKGADGDTSVSLAHGLPSAPDAVIVTAVSGTEAGWRISAIDSANITLVASDGANTRNSSCKIVALVLHSVIK
jgi:hypothetical protein